jgi:hypothetical protein
MNRIFEIISILLVSIAVIVITAFAFGLPISWLWNLFCPKIFGLPMIDWIDGTILYAISRVLFATHYSSK